MPSNTHIRSAKYEWDISTHAKGDGNKISPYLVSIGKQRLLYQALFQVSCAAVVQFVVFTISNTEMVSHLDKEF